MGVFKSATYNNFVKGNLESRSVDEILEKCTKIMYAFLCPLPTMLLIHES